LITFEDLNLSKPLLNALADLDYVNPTPIQEKVFPVIRSGKDIIGIAQTGTGKTFAYLLPLLKELKYSEERHPLILIVVPTRELVMQVVGEIELLSKYMRVRFAGVYGGTNITTQKEIVHKGLDILVGTPGRLLDLNFSFVLRLKSVKKLVIDEVDEMFNLGFRTQLVSLLDCLAPKRQSLMFSATLTPDVEAFISDNFYSPVKIEVAASGTPVEKIIQSAYPVPNFFTKVNLLEHLISDEKKFSRVLVFVKSKKLADRLFKEISTKFPDQIGVIHSNKSQQQRFKAVENFEEGTCRVLIATDLIARGLDITGVSHVINFDTPDVPGDYIHRIGRTGRADASGEAITFVNEAEEANKVAIETLMNKTIPLEKFPEEVDVSTVFAEEERRSPGDKSYLKPHSKKHSKGAYHEKKEKNKKVNLGGPHKRHPEAKERLKRRSNRDH
jgi:ATP-dependent RNA helicase RhlE